MWEVGFAYFTNQHKALFLIQQAMQDDIFSRIMKATTSKEEWKTLQKEFEGDAKVITVKLQTLRSDFKTTMMKNGELVQNTLQESL